MAQQEVRLNARGPDSQPIVGDVSLVASRIASALARRKSVVKWRLLDPLYQKGLLPLRPPTGTRILAYHNAVAGRPLEVNSRFLSSQALEAQIVLLKRHCDVVPLEQLFDSQSQGPSTRLAVSLTFDDGLSNNLTTILPILERQKVHATFFVSAVRTLGFPYLWPDFLDLAELECNTPLSIGGRLFEKSKSGAAYRSNGETLKSYLARSPWSSKIEMFEALPSQPAFLGRPELEPYWRQLTEDELISLARSPWTEIGCHGVTHDRLDVIPETSVRSELQDSKNYVEGILGRSVRAFAFPHGLCNKSVVAMAKEAGFSMLLTVGSSPGAPNFDPGIRSRTGNYNQLSPEAQCAAFFKGRY